MQSRMLTNVYLIHSFSTCKTDFLENSDYKKLKNMNKTIKYIYTFTFYSLAYQNDMVSSIKTFYE